MRSATEPTIGIHRAWRLACADEGMAARIPTRLPLLFALDGGLGVPDGGGGDGDGCGGGGD